jgi:hypothetical protein
MKQLVAGIGLSCSLAVSGALAECQTSELRLAWPMGGTDGVHWVINNYVDLDAGNGVMDYRNNTGNLAKTYNGHNGIDIDLPDFRTMDQGATAWAAEAGTVTEAQSDLFDRNMEAPPGCGPWNHVYIRHPNGFTTRYGHLKQNGVVVKVGDVVERGTTLGLIGSSGCSSTAHLHFEVRDCAGQVVDPFLFNMWTNPPVYDTPLRVMDMTVRKGGFPDPAIFHPTDALLKDPPPNIPTLAAGSRIGVGLSTAGGQGSDRIDVLIRRPNGTVFNTFSPITYPVPARHGWPRWWINLPASGALAGTWQVEVRANNTLVRRHLFQVLTNNRDAVYQGLAEDTYQHTFESMKADQYRPIWVDGSGAPGQGARMSAIYRREGGGEYRTFHNLDGTRYQQEFDAAVRAGLQLKGLDSYVRDGQLRLAAIFSTADGGAWQAYHFVSQQDHQSRFNQLRGQGYRPYAITVAVLNGVQYYSAAYTNLPSRGWTAWNGFNSAEYQAEFNRQTAQGRAPAYLDVYDDGGTPRFSAIWTAEASATPWYARHDLGADAFFQFNEDRARQGYKARVITSYLLNGRRLYAGIWSR